LRAFAICDNPLWNLKLIGWLVKLNLWFVKIKIGACNGYFICKMGLSKTVTPFFGPSEQQASQIMKQRLYPNKSLAQQNLKGFGYKSSCA